MPYWITNETRKPSAVPTAVSNSVISLDCFIERTSPLSSLHSPAATPAWRGRPSCGSCDSQQPRAASSLSTRRSRKRPCAARARDRPPRSAGRARLSFAFMLEPARRNIDLELVIADLAHRLSLAFELVLAEPRNKAEIPAEKMRVLRWLVADGLSCHTDNAKLAGVFSAADLQLERLCFRCAAERCRDRDHQLGLSVISDRSHFPRPRRVCDRRHRRLVM